MTKQKRGAAVAPKVQEAQQRNEMNRRFKTFIAEQSSPEIAEQLTPFEYELIYYCKTGGVKIVPTSSSSNHFTKEELEDIKRYIIYLLKDKQCTMFHGKPKVSLYDILTLGIPFLQFLKINYEEPDKNTPMLEAVFGPMKVIEKQFQDYIIAFYQVSYTVGAIWSRYERGFCYIYPDKVYTGEHKIRTLAFIASRHNSETRKFKIDGHSREAMRVAWFHFNDPIKHLKYHDLTPAELGIEHPQQDKLLQVYIQKHAIHRINERLDSIRQGGATGSIFLSLEKPETIVIRKNQILIALRYNSVKVGYFVATVEDDALLLRTFLFITSNGTPEGNLLKQLTGLQMLDKKYLAIDKLSSFVAKEVTENTQIREIFDKVGCGELFDEKIYNYCEQEFLSKHTPAVKLPSYITNDATEVPRQEEEKPTDYEVKTETLEKVSLKQRTEQAPCEQ
ncbi:hypothetical protein [Williamwhitmania taraxaci]|uniref:Uncharacterized protein n=1 Tax=Williamwhitmania taraxaci TaxID=1640674 RepID=A0A1G6K5L2_9BACT|nr:hypothetical protein [Williamwhitmania taraxaci]SDC25895.1 hypothetical protein SAMN05216323_10239 [Williamwhitmania taraxaci]